MQQLESGSQQLGLALSQRQIEQFEQFYSMLTEWNQKMNLTTITERREVQVKHFLDSLVGLPILAEEMGESLPLQSHLHAIDVGSGAGFPGVPLKIAWPELHLTLLDGTGKKVRFLKALVAELELDNVQVVQGRAEEIGRRPPHREGFDLVTARAVARLNTLVEYLLPLCRVGGNLLIYKGPSANEEFIEARKAIELLGGETRRFAPVEVPHLDEERRILLIHKSHATKETYPRQRGLPRKEPLR